MKYFLQLTTLLLIFSASAFGQTEYFVDATNGMDSNDGLTPATAWLTLTKVNATTFLPNDKIRFKSGETFIGELHPQGSGTAGNPITIDRYGTGVDPIFDAQGYVTPGYNFSATIRLYNQEYWHLTHLKVRNYEVNGNIAEDLMFGILIEARDVGTMHGFEITNTEVYDVNGDLNTRKNGGLAFKITRSNGGNETPSNFDGVLVENCMFHDVSNAGVLTSSDWDTRDLTSSFGQTTVNGSTNEWFPSLNIRVRNNEFSFVHGNGLVIRVADGPLVEHNKFYKCGLLTTGNASYPYNCDNALWQYNEASHTVYNPGDADASGFDSDYFCKNTIIQYNYSHDNEYGGLLITSNGGLSRAFNEGTIIRYNIFQNDAHHVIRVSGKPTNSAIYNNIIYVDSLVPGTMEVLWHKNWHGYPDSTFYYNNIFEVHKAGAIYDFGQSTHTFFENNVFYGNHSASEPNDPYKITTDPLMVAPGMGSFGFGTLDGYKVQQGSPVIDTGKNIPQNGGFDFWGNAVLTVSIDVGAHEFCLPTASIDTHIECDSYTWMDSITYTSSDTTATYVLTNAGGCDSLITLNLTINRVDTSIVRTDTTLSAHATGTYQWLDCWNAMQVLPGQTNQTFIPAQNGSYAVEISQNSCVDTSICYSFNSLSILETDLAKAIVLYPNPTNGTGLFINLNKFSVHNEVSVTIVSILGKMLYHEDVERGTAVIDMKTNEFLSSGQYIVIVKSEKAIIYKKLLVN